jgi:hypothetical protein
MGTRAGNRIRFARGMLGSWQDILELGRDAGPVLLTPSPIFIAFCTNPRIKFSASKVRNPLFSGNVSSLIITNRWDSCGHREKVISSENGWNLRMHLTNILKLTPLIHHLSLE